MKLSVIIPVYNEAATCLQLIQKVQAIPLDKEIIVVNDGSTDSTSELLSQVEGITLLSHTINQGKGAAVQTAAEHIKGDIVILQDGDLEYNPEVLLHTCEPIQTKSGYVFGSRWLGQKNKWSFHYMGNKLITLFSNIINQRWVNDMASCYKAIPADIFPQSRTEIKWIWSRS